MTLWPRRLVVQHGFQTQLANSSHPTALELSDNMVIVLLLLTFFFLVRRVSGYGRTVCSAEGRERVLRPCFIG